MEDELQAKPSQRWGPPALLLVLVMLAFAPTLFGGYLWLDDQTIGNPVLHQPGGIQQVWASSGEGAYQPVSLTLLWILVRLWGNFPFGFHLTCIVIHGLSSLLFYRGFLRLGFKAPWFAAAFFAVHPVQVDTVGWLSAFPVVAMGLFASAALALFSELAAPDRTEAPRNPPLWYGLIFLLVILAGLCHVSGASVPLLFLLLAWYQAGNLRGYAWLLPLAFIGIVAVAYQSARANLVAVDLSLSGLERLLIAGRAFWFYLLKVFVPIDLTFGYDRWPVGNDRLDWLLLGAAVMLVAWLAWASRWLGRGPLCSIAGYAVLLFPWFAGTSLDLDRYSYLSLNQLYLPLAALAPLLAAVLAGLPALVRPSISETTGKVAASAVVLVLGALTFQQARLYAVPEQLYQATVASNSAPGAALVALGSGHLQRQEVAEAQTLFLRLLQVEPEMNRQLHLALLGHTYAAQQNWSEAARFHREATEVNPDFGNAHFQLGVALYRLEARSAAIESVQKAIALEPDDPGYHASLGLMLHESGDSETALNHLGEALSRDPNLPDAHFCLAQILAEKSQIQRAIEECQIAISFTPNNPEWNRFLCSLFADLGDWDTAVRGAQHTLGLAEAHGNKSLIREVRQDLRYFQIRQREARAAATGPATSP